MQKHIAMLTPLVPFEKMKKSPQGIEQRTRGRDNGEGLFGREKCDAANDASNHEPERRVA